MLTDCVDANYSRPYERVDTMFGNGMVSSASLVFLVRPGELQGCLATSCHTWSVEKSLNTEPWRSTTNERPNSQPRRRKVFGC